MNDISVVIATIPGREEMLKRAIDSVHAQTLPADNIVVCLDEERNGAAQTRNKALSSVTTEWLVFLDDDDELLPNHLEVCLNAALEFSADLVYPYPRFIGGRDPLATALNGQVVLPFRVPFGPEQERWMRHRGNFIPITYLVRTSHVKAVGGFPEPYQFSCEPTNVSKDCEDFGLLLALLDYGSKFYHVPKVTWKVHIHGTNTGGRGD